MHIVSYNFGQEKYLVYGKSIWKIKGEGRKNTQYCRFQSTIFQNFVGWVINDRQIELLFPLKTGNLSSYSVCDDFLDRRRKEQIAPRPFAPSREEFHTELKVAVRTYEGKATHGIHRIPAEIYFTQTAQTFTDNVVNSHAKAQSFAKFPRPSASSAWEKNMFFYITNL